MSSDIISNLTSGAIYDNTMDFWNSITAPPLLSILTPYDVATIDQICRDPKLKTKLDVKYEYFNQILEPRGFVKLTQGTNRVVYRFREDERFVIKIATSQAGLQDSPAEFRNQQIWLPDVAKCFEVTPSGTIGSFERVTPIRSKEQLISIIDDVYLFYHKLFRRHSSYVMADVGIEFYKNLGIRDNFGIVLLDYPLAYKIDNNKLFCDRIDRFGHVCDGQIDYDDGFNFLKCTRCGKQYLMKKLAIDSGTIEEVVNKNFIKRKEVSDMKVFVMKGNNVIAESRDNVINSNYINPAVSMRQQSNMPVMANRSDGHLKVSVIRPERTEEVIEETPVIEEKRESKPLEIRLNKPEEIIEKEAPVETAIEEREVEVQDNESEEAIDESTESESSESEDDEEENPYFNNLINNLIDTFDDEVYALHLNVDYPDILLKSDCNYDDACQLLRNIIDTAKAQLEEVERASEGADEEVVEEEPEKEIERVQSAPYPPIEKQQTNVTMNMETKADSVYLGEGSNNKYPAKGKGRTKVTHNFDNY